MKYLVFTLFFTLYAVASAQQRTYIPNFSAETQRRSSNESNQQEVVLPQLSACYACFGRCFIPTLTGWIPCATCGGSGAVTVYVRQKVNNIPNAGVMPNVNQNNPSTSAATERPKGKCRLCHGSGVTFVTTSYHKCPNQCNFINCTVCYQNHCVNQIHTRCKTCDGTGYSY